jgi:putative transposase
LGSNIANEIYELWSKYCFFGYRKITAVLNKQLGYIINHKKVWRLMKEMGLKAVYAKPRTTIIDKTHNKHPYLLKDLIIEQPNQVWAIDITYMKMPIGFVYLASLIDVFSRFVVASKLSINMETDFCLEVLNQGLEVNKPEIVNTDQGSQFTAHDWINCLTKNNIKISMDSVGRWADNIYIERFWRTIKQEQIYINPTSNIAELRKQIEQYIYFYNYQRPHQSLNYNTPHQIYSGESEGNKVIHYSQKLQKIMSMQALVV